MTDIENKLSPCMYNRTIEERKRGCRFCSAACKGRIKESESDVDTQIKSQNEAIKNLNDALNSMEHGGHLPEINAAESLGIPQEEYDKITDECIYGKETELVDTNTWPKEEPVSDPENLEKEVDRLCELYHFTATLGEIRFIARHFAKWQKEIDKLIFYNDLSEFEDIKKLVVNEIASINTIETIDTDFDGWYNRLIVFAKRCAQWQKQQMMKDAVDGEVHHFGDDEIAAVHYNDPKGIPMSYFVSSKCLSAGDKVKLLIIKEDRNAV